MTPGDSVLIKIHRITPYSIGFQPTAISTRRESPAPTRNRVSSKPVSEMLVIQGDEQALAGKLDRTSEVRTNQPINQGIVG
jgi:hypothetical protein